MAAPRISPDPQSAKIDNIRAIGWILTSVVGASVMNVAVRELSGQIDPRMIVLLRAAIIGIGLILMIALWPAYRRGLRFSRPWLHLQRGALIAMATHLGFYTIATIPLATATVLFFMAPIFATLLAILVHGETVGVRRWLAIAAGFLGTVIIMRPGITALHPGMIAALVSSAMFAMALTQSRALSQADGAASAYVSSVFITIVISAPVAAPVLSVPTHALAWAVLALVVLGGAARGYADIEAYRHGEASVLAPILYLRLPLIGTAAYFLYGEVPDAATLTGAAIIIAATLYISRRAARARSRQKPPQKPLVDRDKA